MAMASTKRPRSDEPTVDDDIACCLGLVAQCEAGCDYHRWLSKKGWLSTHTSGSPYSFAECQRLLLIGRGAEPTKVATNTRRLARSGEFKHTTAATTVLLISPTVDRRAQSKIRLAGFLRVIEHLDKAPWANEFFTTNDSMIKRLAASHLPLIVGRKDAELYREYLVTFIDTSVVLTDARNTIWITNRQQVRHSHGKEGKRGWGKGK